MSAWITREYLAADEVDGRGNPKRKREQASANMKDTGRHDQFVVEWIDPDGKRCREKIKGTGRVARRLAQDRCDQLNSQMALGVYQSKDKKTWGEFREQFKAKVLDGKGTSSREPYEVALGHFERLCKPVLMKSVDTEMIDDFIAKRRLERGKKPGSKVSKATVNKDLRHLRRALRKAASWGYIKQAPEFEFLKEDDKLIRYVTAEHFASIYKACEVATMPAAQGYTAADWWRALLVTAYMTGWRIDELTSMLWADVDLDAGKAMLRAQNTKGKRFEELPLHSIVIEHLRKLPSFGREVFAWNDGYKDLWEQFHDIQDAAGIKLICYDARPHECTPSCHLYGFHDLRRAFATQNAPQLTGDALQKLMRHKSYATTQRYINVATQLNRAVDNLHVPTLPDLATA